MSLSGLCSMDGVPLRMPQAAPIQEVKDDVKVTVPDYFNILQKTEVSVLLCAAEGSCQSNLAFNNTSAGPHGDYLYATSC